LVVML